MKLQLKRSNVLISGAAKEPTASQLDYGELAINYSAGDAAIFLKDSTNNVIRISGVGNIADDGLTNVPSTTSPPTSPTPEAGNLWYNSEDGRLYIYYVDDNSSQWVDASPDTWQSSIIPDITNAAHQAGTLDDRYINTNGDTLTGALLLDNAVNTSAPDLAFDGDTNTGILTAGADTLAIATGGVARVVFDNTDATFSGPITATAYNTSSDYRLKDNVVNIVGGITRVKQLQPRRFNFTVEPQKTVDGFIAHEAQTVVPEAVTGEKDGEKMQGIDQSKLVPLLTAALQEAIEKIETLEFKVTALEAK
jgi:hypothetical protein